MALIGIEILFINHCIRLLLFSFEKQRAMMVAGWLVNYNHIKDTETDGTCSTHRGGEKCRPFGRPNGRTILKLTL